MAAGDTISGSVRFLIRDTEGATDIVLGPFNASALDGLNQNLSPEEKVYVNTSKSDKVSAPLQAQEYSTDVQYLPGETMVVQHQSDSLEEAADADLAEAFAINVLRLDNNRGRVLTPTLTAQDNEVTSDPTTSTSEWVNLFEYTVADRQEVRFGGPIEAGAYESA